MANYLKDMNPQKLTKVNDSAKNVQPSKYDRPEKKETKSQPAAAPEKKGPPAKKQPIKKPAASQKVEETSNADEIPVKPSSSNDFDDMPIGGGKKSLGFDE